MSRTTSSTFLFRRREIENNAQLPFGPTWIQFNSSSSCNDGSKWWWYPLTVKHITKKYMGTFRSLVWCNRFVWSKYENRVFHEFMTAQNRYFCILFQFHNMRISARLNDTLDFCWNFNMLFILMLFFNFFTFRDIEQITKYWKQSAKCEISPEKCFHISKSKERRSFSRIFDLNNEFLQPVSTR